MNVTALAMLCLITPNTNAQPAGTSPRAEIDHSQIAEPPVPAALEGKGTVYHTITGGQAQVTFTSNAPLQDIVGKSNGVVGYAVSAGGDAPANLVGAKWVLPVESMATGIPLRDEHLAHEWLHAKQNPTIEFTLNSTENIKLIKSDDGFSTWSLTLVGEMVINGVRKEIRVNDAKLSFLEASEKTAKIAPGDLCFLKCEYEVKLSDFNVAHPDVPDKVSDTIKLIQLLRMSTVQMNPE